jgi:phospholipid-binding lipoprotein MlaA
MAIVTNPVFWFDPEWYVTVPMGVLDAVDQRARIDFLVRFRSETALDPYVFTRNAYLQYRAAQIRAATTSPSEDIYDEDLGPTSRPPTQPSKPTTTPATEVGSVAGAVR